MRGRCAAQFATVVALVGGAMYYSSKNNAFVAPGQIPKEPDSITKAMLNQN